VSDAEQLSRTLEIHTILFLSKESTHRLLIPASDFQDLPFGIAEEIYKRKEESFDGIAKIRLCFIKYF